MDSQVKEGNDKDEDYSSDKAESEDETASESNEDGEYVLPFHL